MYVYMPVFIYYFFKIINALGSFLVLHISVHNLSAGDVLKNKSDLIVGDKDIIPEFSEVLNFRTEFFLLEGYHLFSNSFFILISFFYSELRNEKWYQR